MVFKNSLKNFAIVICGATGTGKSQLAIKLAKLLDSEIISADSIAIYKRLNIGSAKPTQKEMEAVKHHMIDVCEPSASFSVSDYERLAKPILDRLLAAGKIPIICGGTGFYINSLLFDLSYGNCGKNQEIRDKYQQILENFGEEYLFGMLKEFDEKTAQKLHFNDTNRVIRALEIFEMTGRKKSEIIDKTTEKINYFAFSYDFDRTVLYDRINQRVEKMFSNGLTGEVLSLKKEGLKKENQSMQAIGYKEFFEFENEIFDIEKIKDAIKQNSRRYAKRQITFFKKLKNIRFLESFNTEQATNEIIRIINDESLR